MSPLRLTLVLSLVGCATDPSGPAAPTSLTVGLLGAGAHLTWTDNSADELEFIIMRQEVGADADMIEISRVPFDTVAFHDEPISSGASYVYMVIATNGSGDTLSNQATFVAP